MVLPIKMHQNQSLCAECRLYETVGGFGMLLAITQDSDNPEWDHRSLQLLMEEVGPRVANLGRG